MIRFGMIQTRTEAQLAACNSRQDRDVNRQVSAQTDRKHLGPCGPVQADGQMDRAFVIWTKMLQTYCGIVQVHSK